jgi:hypothetical protein
MLNLDSSPTWYLMTTYSSVASNVLSETFGHNFYRAKEKFATPPSSVQYIVLEGRFVRANLHIF